MPELEASKLEQLEDLRKRSEEANERETEALIEEVKKLRQESETTLAKLAAAAEALRAKSRRIQNASSSSLVIFATAHLRFAGAAIQGMKRTTSMDRMIDRAKANKEEEARREEQERRWAEERAAKKKIQEMVAPSDDAFDELYGEVVDPPKVVNHAE